MGRNKGYIVQVGGKFMMSEDDSSGMPKLTMLLSRAAVYPSPDRAAVAMERLGGDQAHQARVVRR